MTLIEVMVALLILFVVGVAISRLLVSSWQSQGTITDQNEAQKRAQQAIDKIVDELRASSGALAPSPADPGTVSALFLDAHTVRYYRQGTDLQREYHAGTTSQIITVCHGVTGLTVKYYQRVLVDGLPELVEVTNPALAESIGISLTVALGKSQATETSIVRLRNKPLRA